MGSETERSPPGRVREETPGRRRVKQAITTWCDACSGRGAGMLGRWLALLTLPKIGRICSGSLPRGIV